MARPSRAVSTESSVDVNGYITGTLQAFCEGAEGAVCSSKFDDLDAQVTWWPAASSASSLAASWPALKFPPAGPGSTWQFATTLGHMGGGTAPPGSPRTNSRRDRHPPLQL